MGEINITDQFGRSIFDTVLKYKLKRVLEIGSWDGTGSTQCFLGAMQILNDEDKRLTCLEVNTERYSKLVENISPYKWAKAYNKSSVSFKHLTYTNFNDIWNSPYNGMQKHPTPSSYDTVEKWFNEDIDSIKRIEPGYLEEDNLFYDAVLIDGSEFTGYSEYTLLKDRVNVLFLDDYYKSFKTNQIVRELEKNNKWEVISFSRDLRNGFAVFKRKEFI